MSWCIGVVILLMDSRIGMLVCVGTLCWCQNCRGSTCTPYQHNTIKTSTQCHQHSNAMSTHQHISLSTHQHISLSTQSSPHQHSHVHQHSHQKHSNASTDQEYVSTCLCSWCAGVIVDWCAIPHKILSFSEKIWIWKIFLIFESQNEISQLLYCSR
jgi:hypothetical protein